MEFVWALFFVGGGGIQPIDTGYRFDSKKECVEAQVRASYLEQMNIEIIANKERIEVTPLSWEERREKPLDVIKIYKCIVKK